MAGILYYDCFAGISGDMNLAALIDLGVDFNYLVNELKKLHIDEYQIIKSKDIRRGISGTRIDVEVHEHTHEHQHHGHEHHHHAPHRTFKDIRDLIENSQLSGFVKKSAISIFKKLAEAEGKIHDKPVDEVHFHEVGAVDSIVDIVGAAVCLEFLKPEKIISSSIELGSGMVKCAHGLFPVPAPATAETLKGIPVKSGTVPFEATTPTGAAILAVMVNEFSDRLKFTIEKTAYGIGHKDSETSEVPNVLRVHLCTAGLETFKTENAIVLECNIDDMNPEVYEFIMEKMFAEGADDVYITPMVMKKSRPSVMLSVLCNHSLKDKFIGMLLKETSSLGVRTYDVTKHMLEREISDFQSSFGIVKVKKSWSGNILKLKPEYDDCKRIAREKNISLIDVINTIQKELNK